MKDFLLVALLFPIITGCVSLRHERVAVDAAYRAGLAEKCTLDLRSWARKVEELRHQLDTTRLQLRIVCEKSPRYQLVNDVCVDAEGK